MIHYLFIGLSWLVGALGVGGAAAAIAATVWLGPAAVVPIVSGLFSRFVACAKCVAAVAAVLATVGAYWVGRHEAAATCKADQLEAELRVKKIDLENAEKAKADEAARADNIEAQANEQHKQDLEYIAKLTALPACALPGGVPGGLRVGPKLRLPKAPAGPRKSDAACTRPGSGIDARCAWRLNTSALLEANRRLSESAAWYESVRASYEAR